MHILSCYVKTFKSDFEIHCSIFNLNVAQIMFRLKIMDINQFLDKNLMMKISMSLLMLCEKIQISF